MTIKRQLITFLLICLPITWILAGIPILFGVKDVQASAWAYALYMLACFMPAITAIICCVFSKESIRSLNILPNLQGNGKTYALAILSALAISIFDAPLMILLFFPSVGTLNPEMTVSTIIFQVLLYTAIGCVQFYVLMGEEVGWMGYLFPKLEQLYGTNAAIIMTGLVRGLWHLPMLVQNERFIQKLLWLCVTNIVGGCLLVLLTKRSGSVVPAAVCHALNNTLPTIMYSFLILDEAVYEKHEMVISAISNIPYFIIMMICWYILKKKNDSKQGV